MVVLADAPRRSRLDAGKTRANAERPPGPDAAVEPCHVSQIAVRGTATSVMDVHTEAERVALVATQAGLVFRKDAAVLVMGRPCRTRRFPFPKGLAKILLEDRTYSTQSL